MSKVPFQFPWESAVIPETTGEPSYVMVIPVSLLPNPVPVTDKVTPGAPLDRLVASVGLTVKFKELIDPASVTEPKAPTV
jgi:hypothetical protein